MAYHTRVSELKAMTVVETPAFIAAATRCLSEEERHGKEIIQGLQEAVEYSKGRREGFSVS